MQQFVTVDSTNVFRINGYAGNNRAVAINSLAERYERGSVLLTSNLAFSKWEQIYKDAMTTAAIDRLVHHSVITEMNVPSYRVKKAEESKLTQQTKLNEQQTTNRKNITGNSNCR